MQLGLAWLAFAVHVAYIAFVGLGFVAILVGIVGGRWQWTRNARFRLPHLALTAFVMVEAVAGVTCPLTRIENWLRLAAGAEPYERSFVGHLLEEIVFYNGPEWVFGLVYVVFGAAVIATFALAPPRGTPHLLAAARANAGVYARRER